MDTLVIIFPIFDLFQKNPKSLHPSTMGKGRENGCMENKENWKEYIYFLLSGSHLKMEENEWSCVFFWKILV